MQIIQSCHNTKTFFYLKTSVEQNLIIKQTHELTHTDISENEKQISKRFFFPRIKFRLQTIDQVV